MLVENLTVTEELKHYSYGKLAAEVNGTTDHIVNIRNGLGNWKTSMG